MLYNSFLMICPEKKVHGDRKYVPGAKKEKGNMRDDNFMAMGCFMGCFMGDEKVLKLGEVDGCTTVKTLKYLPL